MSCSSTVIRPKSIATVVVDLSGTALVSSTPSDSAVRSCSVVSGGISESDPTKVVLPAPNPPATRILSGTSPAPPRPARGGRALTRTESIQQPPEDRRVGGTVAGHRPRQVHRQVAGAGEVADQHPGDDDGDLEQGA